MLKAIAKRALLGIAGMVMLAGTIQAQSVWINAVGASAQWKTWGYAAIYALPQPTKHWTRASAGGVDDTARNGSIPIQKGNIWVVWSENAQGQVTDIAAYTTVDSTVGIRAMYASPATTLWLDPTIGSLTGQNLLTGFTDQTYLPPAVIAALAGRPFNIAFSEVRPEDAKHASDRMFSLGYGTKPIGSSVISSFSSKSVQAIDFNISGNDPITNVPVRTDLKVRYIGASPVIVFVNHTATNPGALGQKNASGEPIFQNVRLQQLAGFFDGSFSRTKDILEDYTIPDVTTTTILREPLSGTYNTFEYNVPASSGIASSQERGVTTNPLNQVSAGGGTRKRAIGSGEMVDKVISTPNSLGYCFWGYGNFGNAYANTHYIKVNGVDPLLDNYHTYGWYPDPALVTMSNVKNGTYPLWGIYHAVYSPAVEGYVDWLQVVSESILPYIPEYIPYSQMKVFRSHFERAGISPHNGNIAGIPASGGNVGGMVYPIQADIDYFTFTGQELVNRKQ